MLLTKTYKVIKCKRCSEFLYINSYHYKPKEGGVLCLECGGHKNKWELFKEWLFDL